MLIHSKPASGTNEFLNKIFFQYFVSFLYYFIQLDVYNVTNTADGLFRVRIMNANDAVFDEFNIVTGVILMSWRKFRQRSPVSQSGPQLWRWRGRHYATTSNNPGKVMAIKMSLRILKLCGQKFERSVNILRMIVFYSKSDSIFEKDQKQMLDNLFYRILCISCVQFKIIFVFARLYYKF